MKRTILVLLDGDKADVFERIDHGDEQIEYVRLEAHVVHTEQSQKRHRQRLDKTDGSEAQHGF